MVYISDNLDHYILTNNGTLVDYKIKEVAKVLAFQKARGDYPEAVIRSESELRKIAAQRFQFWESNLKNNYIKSSRDYERTRGEEIARTWKHLRDEAWQLFSAVFVSVYCEEARVTLTTPSTSTTGATITVTRVEHTGDIHRYWLKLEDPTYFDESYEFPDIPVLRVDFSEAQASDTLAAATSSSYGAFASSSSDIVTLPEHTSETPQKKKKPRIGWEK